MRTTPRWALLVLSAALLTAGCGDTPAEPAIPAPELAPRRALGGGPTLLRCPVDSASSTQAIIGPLGGSLELNGHRVVIPPLAVAGPTAFTLTEPASEYVEVEVHADGFAHFVFLRPVAITLSYARCAGRVDPDRLSIFYIDGLTKRILEDMGVVDAWSAGRLTTFTGHLSGYAVGGN